MFKRCVGDVDVPPQSALQRTRAVTVLAWLAHTLLVTSLGFFCFALLFSTATRVHMNI